ncbi:MAG: nuclear transport factor 2 family protein [Bacteroidales bacterium]|nr:nuclear transport factor 2 family protein [Bacteroidales bacterium]
MTDSELLRQVSDRQQITDLIYRYCRAMDRIDAELGYTIWHDDAVADYGADVYQGSGRGFIDHVCAVHRRTLHHSHQVTNIIIQLDGDTAASEAYVTGTLRMMRDDKLFQVTAWSRYIDQWSRRDGRWGIDKRVAVMDFDEIREVTAMNKLSRASRDHNDPSYRILKNPG